MNEGTTPIEGILLEVAGTLLLCSAAYVASTRFKKNFRMQALVEGTSLFLLFTAVIGPFSGACFNRPEASDLL